MGSSPLMIVNPDKFLIPQFPRLKGRMKKVLKWTLIKEPWHCPAYLDVQVRGAVAVGAHQDPVVPTLQQLLDGPAQGERLASPVGPEDDDRGQGELQGGGDGPDGLPLLGVESLRVPRGQLRPLGGRGPGDWGRPGMGLSEEKSVRKQPLWRGKNPNFNNFTLSSQLRSNSNYPIFLKTF